MPQNIIRLVFISIDYITNPVRDRLAENSINIPFTLLWLSIG